MAPTDEPRQVQGAEFALEISLEYFEHALEPGAGPERLASLQRERR